MPRPTDADDVLRAMDAVIFDVVKGEVQDLDDVDTLSKSGLDESHIIEFAEALAQDLECEGTDLSSAIDLESSPQEVAAAVFRQIPATDEDLVGGEED